MPYLYISGTGTPRGDPTEINALGKFFARSRNRTPGPLFVGSVKSNIGHTESAAGMAGLIKVLLMMKNGKYVPSLHVKSDNSNINEKIELSNHNLEIIKNVKPWPVNSQHERHACLNSFGFGGSNTHAIISQKKETFTTRENITSAEHAPVCISGLNIDSFKQNLSQFCIDVEFAKEKWYDVAITSLYHRDVLPYRTLLHKNDIKELKTECKKRVNRMERIIPTKNHNKVFVYCGVGTTWTGMCQEMMKESHVFQAAIDNIDVHLKPLTGWKIKEKFVSFTNYDDPLLNHIAIFSVQVGLTELWKSFGVFPDIIVGQSVGEVAAAYAANHLSLDEAVRVIYHRSNILSQQAKGSMTVVGNLDIENVKEVCEKNSNCVCIAVYSSPSACTISGDTKELNLVTDTIRDQYGDRNIFIRKLNVQCAYHSPILDCCVEQIKQKVDDSLGYNGSDELGMLGESTVSMISTVTGSSITNIEMKSGNYWAENVRCPVKFMQAIKKSYDDESNNVYLEIGPRPVLKTHLPNILGKDKDFKIFPSMRPKTELDCLKDSLVQMFELGIDIDIASFTNSREHDITSIPRTVFNRTGDLFIPASAREYLGGFFNVREKSHMFVETSNNGNDLNFYICIDYKSTPFVYDHFLSGNIIVPGATYVETGYKIGIHGLKRPTEKLSVGFNFLKTFTPVSGKQHRLKIDLESQNFDEIKFSVLSGDNLLALGKVSKRTAPVKEPLDIVNLEKLCPNRKSKSECYDSLSKIDFRYGDSLSLIQGARVSRCGTKCLATIKVPDCMWDEITRTYFHPAIIDSVFQIFGIISGESSEENSLSIPRGVDAVVVNRPVETVMYVYGEKVKITEQSTHCNGVLLTANGAVIAEVENFHSKNVSTDLSFKNHTANAFMLNWSEVLELQSVNILKHYLLFSTDPESAWIQELKKQVVTITEAQPENMSTLSNEQNMKNIVIIYHVGGVSDLCDTGQTGEVLDSAVRRISELKNILANKEHLANQVPVIVITENTQLCPKREYFNYIGAELWGMLRSALHEGMYKDIKLLDIDRHNIDIQSLIKLLAMSDDREKEFALSGSKLYRARFRSHQGNYDLRRQVHETNERLSICSTQSKTISNPYLLLTCDNIHEDDAVSVDVESFTKHSESLYLPVLSKETDADLVLRTAEKDDFTVIAIEGRGKIQQGQNKVLFLCPVNAETTINIPRDHLIDVKDCPANTNGILILLNLLIHISWAITNGEEVVILKENEEADIAEDVLNKLLERKKCEIRYYTYKRLEKDKTSFSPATVVVTSLISTKKLNLIAKRFPGLDRILSLNICFPDHLRRWAAHTLPGLDITVLSTFKMLSMNGIWQALPTIREYSRQLPATTKTNNLFLKLPLENINIRAQIQGGTLKYFCKKDNLFRPQACYIVVGGLTGLGWELVQLMAEMNAGIILTLSRKKPTDVVAANIRRIQEKYSCSIVPMQVDISDKESVKNVFSKIQFYFPDVPVKGIFHGAGVVSDSLLENMDEEKVLKVMKPKVLGVLNLHAASINLPLDYFVMHSSIVSLLGNAGQCNYAAANSFLDSFALYRRSIGLPAQSINWGALNLGMAVQSEDVKALLKKSGFINLEQQLIREFFLEAMANDTTNIVYAAIEWDKLLSIPTFAMQLPKFGEFKTVRLSESPDLKQVSFDPSEFHSLDERTRKEKLKSIIKDIMFEVLVTDEKTFTDEMPFTNIGIDSMAAMSLSNAFDEKFKCRIPVVIFLSESTTLSTLLEKIEQNLYENENRDGLKNKDMITSSKFQNLFESSDVTFMQKDLLESYVHNRNDPYYLIVIDVELEGAKFEINEWYNILGHVLKMNPELTKKFIFSNDGKVAIETVSVKELDLDIAMLSVTAMENNYGQDVRKDLKADIHNSLPVSFRIIEGDKKTILRIINHKVVIDMKSLSLLCRDIESTCRAVFRKQDLPHKNDSLMNISDAVKKAVLPRMEEYESFWNKYMDFEFSPITFGTRLENIDVSYCCCTRVEIPNELFSSIRSYTTKLGMSLYEFLMSIYQLYLFIASGSSPVTVGTAADMRFHVPELNNIITRCTNYIPLVAHIDENQSISRFVQENSDQLSAATKHGAYPSSLILKKLQSETARENMFRHFLAMNDMKEMKHVLREKEGVKGVVKNIWHVRPNRETFMFVRFDLQKEWIELELGYNSKICGEFGKTFTKNLLRLAKEVTESGHQTVADVRDRIKKDVIVKTSTEANTNKDYEEKHVNDERPRSLKNLTHWDEKSRFHHQICYDTLKGLYLSVTVDI